MQSVRTSREISMVTLIMAPCPADILDPAELCCAANIVQAAHVSFQDIIKSQALVKLSSSLFLPSTTGHSLGECGAHTSDFEIIFKKLTESPEIFHLPLSLPSLILLPFAIAVPAAYLPLDKPYWISNILALSLATTTLALLRLDSFFTAFLLLGVLLVYDVFWVGVVPLNLLRSQSHICSPPRFASPTVKITRSKRLTMCSGVRHSCHGHRSQRHRRTYQDTRPQITFLYLTDRFRNVRLGRHCRSWAGYRPVPPLRHVSTYSLVPPGRNHEAQFFQSRLLDCRDDQLRGRIERDDGYNALFQGGTTCFTLLEPGMQ